jgi:hypothetical protein
MFGNKKRIAHFILNQLLRESLKEFGSPHFIDSNGVITIYRKGQSFQFAESKARIKYMADQGVYSVKQISDGINLLAANKHIEIEGELGGLGYEHTQIKATQSGILAFEENYYNVFNYEKWTFWLAAVLGTSIALLGLLLTVCKK